MSGHRTTIATIIDYTTDAGCPLPPNDEPKPDVFKEALANLSAEEAQTNDQNKSTTEKGAIRVTGGALPANVDAAEVALIESDANLFQRGEMLVRPGEVVVGVRGGKRASDLLLVAVKRPELIELMTTAAQFQRWDARKDDWKAINCPNEIADAYLGRIGRWNLRPLMGIINAPTLRPDGGLLDAPGYDAQTGLLYDPRGVEFPPIPSHPTRNDALVALKSFDELISEFPFATAEARAVALAAILTSCIRRTLPTAPLFGVDGTGPGTGKGLLADTVATIGCGRAASPITSGANPEELEKRLASIFIRGDGAVCIDNLNGALDSDFLCAALTQQTLSVRVLGQSRVATTPTNCLFMATGNGLSFAGDMWRRAVTCLIDPALERPSERVFAFNPVERAKENRARYVAAGLTVLRAYQAAGIPEQNGRPMGSFEVWCRTVRDALLWLGEADPVLTCAPPMDDPERERFAAVLLGWDATIGDQYGLTLKGAVEAAIKAATGTPSQSVLFDAFSVVAAPPGENRGRDVVIGTMPDAGVKDFIPGHFCASYASGPTSSAAPASLETSPVPRSIVSRLSSEPPAAAQVIFSD